MQHNTGSALFVVLIWFSIIVVLSATQSDTTTQNNGATPSLRAGGNPGGRHRSSHSIASCNLANLGKEHDVDKFDHTHRYEHLYCDIFAPYHNAAVMNRSPMGSTKMLEIGLGCGHPTPSPRSASLWSVYLPSTTYYAIDWIPPSKGLTEENCLRAMEQNSPITLERNIRSRVYFGDQADRKFLRETMTKILTESLKVPTTSDIPQGVFDIIIDDGGHTFNQQRTSFQELWPFLKEGGIYVIEDLQAEKTGMPVVVSRWIELMAGGIQGSADSKNYRGKYPSPAFL